MKTITAVTIALLGFSFFSCGMSKEEKNKIIESAADMRANSFCIADTATMGKPLEVYEYYLDALSAGLKDQGIEGDDYSAAVDLFDAKIKANCPEKYPK